MTPVPIERSTVTVRLNGIQQELAELHKVLKNHLKDVDIFCKAVKSVLKSPRQFHLSVD